MTMPMVFIFAAAVGAVLRYLADFYLPTRGILLVNVLGSCLAGVIVGLTWAAVVDTFLAELLLGGFAGSMTTYSTVALSTARQTAENLNTVVVTWLEHVGWSTAACVIGLLATVHLW